MLLKFYITAIADAVEPNNCKRTLYKAKIYIFYDVLDGNLFKNDQWIISKDLLILIVVPGCCGTLTHWELKEGSIKPLRFITHL